MISVTGRSADREASSVFDSAKNLDGSPSTKLQPGSSVKFRLGFGVQDADDLVLDVSPGVFEHESVTFTS